VIRRIADCSNSPSVPIAQAGRKTGPLDGSSSVLAAATRLWRRRPIESPLVQVVLALAVGGRLG